MKVNSRLILSAAFVPFVWAVACDKESTSPAESREVEELRASLAPYASLGLAKNAGYSAAITDCMSNGESSVVRLCHLREAVRSSLGKLLHRRDVTTRTAPLCMTCA